MKELLYFSSSDLMIQVSYESDLNSLHYFSHRALSFGERVIVEQYLLTNVAVKTEYYKKHPAMLNYNGIDSKLVKELNQFHLKNTIDVLKEKEKEVKGSVKKLIDQSMSNYYFEQIGNTILDLRDNLDDCPSDEILSSYSGKLQQLLDAYNVYADKKVTFDEIVPDDLRCHLQA